MPPALIRHDLKSLLGLAWPIIISRSTQVVVGLADALMVAHLGEAALAAVTAGAMNSYAAFIFPMGVAFIVSSYSSQLTGRGDPRAARRYGWYGLAVAVGAQILAFAAIPFLPRIFGWFHYEPAVAADMCAYLSIRFFSTGAGVGIEALGNYYGGTGRTSILMWANLSAMILNVFFNWLLIDGHWGCPALGFRGAAWGSVLSVTLAFLGFLAVFLRHGRRFPKPRLRYPEFLRMLRFGLPSGLNWSLEFFAILLFINVVIASLGTASLAALMAVFQINSVSFMPAFGLGSAGAILVGQSIGAKRKQEVPGIVRLTFLASAVWMGIAGLVYVSVPALLLAPFVPDQGPGSAFMRAGVAMLFLSAFWQIFDAAGITLGEALRAAGDTAYPMWSRIVLAWGVFLPGSWLTGRYLGGAERTAIGWFIAYLALLAIVLWLRFRSGAWRRIRLVEERLPV